MYCMKELDKLGMINSGDTSDIIMTCNLCVYIYIYIYMYRYTYYTYGSPQIIDPPFQVKPCKQVVEHAGNWKGGTKHCKQRYFRDLPFSANTYWKELETSIGNYVCMYVRTYVRTYAGR